MTRRRQTPKLSISYGRAVALLLLLSLTACASQVRPTQPEDLLQYIPPQGAQLLNRHAPTFLIEDFRRGHNRIGKVRANSANSVYVDPDSPVLYAEQRQFSTAKGEYTNLIYRIQFTEVPDGYAPFYLSAGKNVGLLFIVTLNATGQPLLYTTVHTCGCYLAIIPTNDLPSTMRPLELNKERLSVFGESLPAELNDTSASSEQSRIHLRIRADTHRVSDLWLAPINERLQPSMELSLQPLEDLKQLPLGNGQTTSFYEVSGAREGHVKGSYKTRERLLMSWWAFDWNIGQDKYLGANLQDGPVFYTSLKPWARKESDLRDFAGFLKYWGWNL